MLLAQGHATRKSRSWCPDPSLTKDRAQAPNHCDKETSKSPYSKCRALCFSPCCHFLIIIFKCEEEFFSALASLELPCIHFELCILQLLYFIFQIVFVYISSFNE